MTSRSIACLVLAVSFALAQATPTSTATAGEDGAPKDAPPADAGSGAAKKAAKLVDAFKDKDASKRLEAAQAAKDDQDEALLKPLVGLLTDEFESVRTAAVEALGARSDPKARKAAAKAVAGRLPKLAKKVGSEEELVACCKALGALRDPSTVKALLSDISTTTDRDVVEARCEAVARIPHADAIEGLIKLMSASGRRNNGKNGTRGIAGRGLTFATGERFGSDADAWRAWWKTNAKSFDFEAAAEKRAEVDAARKKREDRKGKGRRGDKGDNGGKRRGGGDTPDDA